MNDPLMQIIEEEAFSLGGGGKELLNGSAQPFNLLPRVTFSFRAGVVVVTLATEAGRKLRLS